MQRILYKWTFSKFKMSHTDLDANLATAINSIVRISSLSSNYF